MLLLVPCWAPLACIVLSLFFLIASSSRASFYSSSFNLFCKSFVICCTFFSLSVLKAVISFSCFYVFCLHIKIKVLQFFDTLFQGDNVLVLSRFLIVWNLLLLIKLFLQPFQFLLLGVNCRLKIIEIICNDCYIDFLLLFNLFLDSFEFLL